MRRNPLRYITWSLCLMGGLSTSGCKDDPSRDDAADSGTEGASSGTGDGTADETGTAGEPTVTYWEDVAPILYESCVSCHQQGGIGPFSLETYADAQAWAPAVTAAMQSRTMPPWLVTDDGSCGDFSASRWMADEDIDTVAAWLAEGTPEGTPRDDLTVPQSPGIAQPTVLATPNFAPEIQGGDLAEFDEYRCFMVDPQLPADRFLTAYDVLPGNTSLVHHVIVMPVDPTQEVDDGMTNGEVMLALDDESPEREGWPCFGEAGEGVAISGMPVVWAPGQGVVQFPEGTGLRVRQQEVLVIQVHYNLADPATHGMTDQSEVHLRLEEQVDREGFMMLVDPFLNSIFEGDPVSLPPGEASVPYTWEMPMSDLLGFTGLEQVELFGVFPHMHEHGRSIRMDIDGPGGPECATDVPRWDFGWQLQYFYEQPRMLTEANTLQVTCDFDTRGETEPVLAGWGTHNEMCLMGLYLVP